MKIPLIGYMALVAIPMERNKIMRMKRKNFNAVNFVAKADFSYKYAPMYNRKKNT